MTAHATSVGGTASRSETVTVTLPSGRAEVMATFIPAPLIREIALAAYAGTCALARTASDASCRVPFRPGETVAITASLDTIAGALLGWSDDCGGTFAVRDLAQLPAAATYDWTSPSAGGPVVCTLTPTLELSGMTDAFPIAVLVTDAPPP